MFVHLFHFSPFHLHLHSYCLFCFHFCFLPHQRQTDSRDASLCNLRPTKRHPCGRRQWWGPPLPGDPLWGRSWTQGSNPWGSPALCTSPSASSETRYVSSRSPISPLLSCASEKNWFSLHSSWYSQCPWMPYSYGWCPQTQAGSLVKSVHDYIHTIFSPLWVFLTSDILCSWWFYAWTGGGYLSLCHFPPSGNERGGDFQIETNILLTSAKNNWVVLNRPARWWLLFSPSSYIYLSGKERNDAEWNDSKWNDDDASHPWTRSKHDPAKHPCSPATAR